jgi:hypothetical protein
MIGSQAEDPMWWRRRSGKDFDRPVSLDGRRIRLADGDTVLKPGYPRWSELVARVQRTRDVF